MTGDQRASPISWHFETLGFQLTLEVRGFGGQSSKLVNIFPPCCVRIDEAEVRLIYIHENLVSLTTSVCGLGFPPAIVDYFEPILS